MVKHSTTAKSDRKQTDSGGRRLGVLAAGMALVLAVFTAQRLSAALMGPVMFTGGLLLIGISPALLILLALRLFFNHRLNSYCRKHKSLAVTAFLALCLISLAAIAFWLHVNHSLVPILRDIMALMLGS